MYGQVVQTMIKVSVFLNSCRSVHHCIARAYFYRKAGDRISLSLEGDSCTSGTVDQDHVLAARGHGAVILARELPA